MMRSGTDVNPPTGRRRLVIRNGTLVTSRHTFRADVACVDGKIERLLEPGAPFAADEEIDASGRLVFAGFIDSHVHSRDPGLVHKEDFAHSTRAAAAGGVTTVCEMPNAIPPVTSASVFEERAAHHARVASVDFALWGLALGTENLGEIHGMLEAGAVGVKLFWGYALNRRTKQLVYNLADEPPDNLIPPPDTGGVFELCQEIARLGGVLAVHCEDRALLEASERALGGIRDYEGLLRARPDTAEAVSIAIAAELSRATGCRVHVVHMASARGAEIVRRSQAEGISLSAETCPQYLTLTDTDYSSVGPMMKVYPPIRRAADQEALWQAIRDGAITSVGSDHAPHTVEEKAGDLATAPAGFPGVETLVPLLVSQMLAGRITPERLAWVLSEGTARLYGLHPRKGAIEPGADADFTLVDPEGSSVVDRARLHSKHPQTPWHGRRLRGAVNLAVLGGEVIMRDGEPVGPPRGQLVQAAHVAPATGSGA